MNDTVVLKAGKDKAIRNRHHWIFSGAIETYPKFVEGDLLPVVSHTKEPLGWGYFNRKGSIAGRMVSFNSKDPLDEIKQRLTQAISLRQQLFDRNQTNAYRLVNGEGDAIPGLTVDQYNHSLVIQLSTLGMDRLRPWVLEQLQHLLNPNTIFEKSSSPSRREEGLKDVIGTVLGEKINEIEILESGLKFIANFAKGQKTGFFLDHREMRSWVKNHAMGKRVLNCFSYTGGFSVYAMAGGATQVDSVDISEEAMLLAKKHFSLNGFNVSSNGFYVTDAFQFLRDNSLNYDFVILDPPAFAKKKKDVVAACRGYKDINRLVFEKLPPNSFLLTSSCSYHVDPTLFQQVIFQAASEAKRNVKIIGRHTQAPDHPINLFHPEGDYLKSLLLYID